MRSSSYITLFVVVIAICCSAEKKRPRTACKDPAREINKMAGILGENEYFDCLDEAQFDIMKGLESVNATQTAIICGSKACHGLKKLVEDANLEDCLLYVIDQEIAINYDINSIFNRCGSLYTPPPSKPEKKVLPTDLQFAVPVEESSSSSNSTNITNLTGSSNSTGTSKSNSTVSTTSKKSTIGACSPELSKTITDILKDTKAVQCRDNSKYDLHLSEGEPIPDAMCTLTQCHETWNNLSNAISTVKPCTVDLDGIPVDLTLALRHIDEKCGFSKNMTTSSTTKNESMLFDKSIDRFTKNTDADTTTAKNDNSDTETNDKDAETNSKNHGTTSMISTIVIFISFSVMFML